MPGASADKDKKVTLVDMTALFVTGGVRESTEEEAGHTIKRYKPEQIVTLLRQIEAGIANGKPTPQACNEAEIPVQTY